MEKYLREWANQCKAHGWMLVEAKLRQAADELRDAKLRIRELEKSQGIEPKQEESL